jgi:hypothetical protein
VVPGVALGVGCTVIPVDAGVNALAVDASLVVGTFVVRLASGGFAPGERVPFEAWWTSAVGPVKLCVAFSVDCTRISDVARVDALPVVTGLVIRAFSVALASGFKIS